MIAASACGCATSSADAQSAVPLATATADQPADEPATLDVLATPDTKVLIDGRLTGITPLKGLRVTPGQHDVTFVDETGNRTMTVSLQPGEGKTVKSDRPPVPIPLKR